MTYRIARNGQVFGPYTTAQIHEYLQTGNVLLTDLAQLEGTEEWVPVEQLFPAAPTQRPYGAPPVSVPIRLYPDPPDLPWWALLLLTIVTGGLFSSIWAIVQSGWLHRIDRNSRALWLYVASLVWFAIRIPGTYHDVAHNIFGGPMYVHPHWLGASLISLILWIATRFVFRSELEQHFNTAEPIGLRLSGVMTFFFGVIYFQYHFNRINEIKRMMRVSVPS